MNDPFWVKICSYKGIKVILGIIRPEPFNLSVKLRVDDLCKYLDSPWDLWFMFQHINPCEPFIVINENYEPAIALEIDGWTQSPNITMYSVEGCRTPLINMFIHRFLCLANWQTSQNKVFTSIISKTERNQCFFFFERKNQCFNNSNEGYPNL